jgi:hypothetical protein
LARKNASWLVQEFDELAGFRRLDPDRPSAGREFTDSIDRKIGQAREHRAQVVAVRQTEAATSFDLRGRGIREVERRIGDFAA